MTCKPKVTVLDSPEAVADLVADMFANTITENSQSVLGLATGGSPVATYRRLIDQHRTTGLDFSQVVSFNLDEYVGLPPDHPQSFRYFMHQHLFDHININLANTHVPSGISSDVSSHASTYENQIKAAGGIDLQLLGIGSNGHIAFNEPGSSADSRTREVALTAQTIEANSRFFESSDDVPKTAITMGIGTIMEARRIVLIAYGDGKSQAVADAINGPVSAVCPASLLRQHRDVTYVVDRDAASRL